MNVQVQLTEESKPSWDQGVKVFARPEPFVSFRFYNFCMLLTPTQFEELKQMLANETDYWIEDGEA